MEELSNLLSSISKDNSIELYKYQDSKEEFWKLKITIFIKRERITISKIGPLEKSINEIKYMLLDLLKQKNK